MAARGTFTITKPEGVEMTLTITMSVKEWKLVKQQLRPSNSDAEWYLDDSIRQMIEKAGQEFRFYENVERTEASGG